MLSLSKIKSPENAKTYFTEVDDYYSRDAGASSEWFGNGADKLKLNSKQIDAALFKEILEGNLPDGTKIGGENHTPGWDATFSAPKSLSALALAGGDIRLVQAHDKAVNDALLWLQKEAAFTRIKDSNGDVESFRNESLLVGKFRHETNREKDPQLHTHAVIMNATYDEVSGKWRSLDSRELYQVKMMAGFKYRQFLAENTAKLGYKIEVTKIGKEVGFEIGDIQPDLIKYWSSRSAQVESYLKEQGLTRETATAQQKQEATLATRKAKGVSDHDELKLHWQKDALAHGVNLNHLVGNAEVREAFAISEFEQNKKSEALKSLTFAISKLEERSSVFSKEELIKEVSEHSFAKTDSMSIENVIKDFEKNKKLYSRALNKWDATTGSMVEVEAYTTERNLQIESRMISAARSLSNFKNSKALMSQAQAKIVVEEMVSSSKYPWNDAQINATKNILSSKSRLNLIQGYAGTSKTNSVMKGLASEFEKAGYEVKPLAPTASAADTLGEALGAQGQTVQSYLLGQDERTGKPRVLIVDEASLMSSNDTRRLLERAVKHGDRVVLTGDVKQLGSVESGEAFMQLQQDGHRTEVLDVIVRQTNEELRDAVYDSLNGNTEAALSKVTTIELEKREDRLFKIAEDYTSLSLNEREKTLLVAPGRDDRESLNQLIRSRMIETKELSENKTVIEIFKSKDMTKAESLEAKSYEIDDYIEFHKNYKSIGIEKGERAKVIAIDKETNKIKLLFDNTRTIDIDPNRVTKLGVFNKSSLEIREGDKLIRTATINKEKKELNGSELRVVGIDIESGYVTVNEANKIKRLSVKELEKVDHSYVQTAHQAQGKTFERAYALCESYRSNLVNQRAFYVQLSRAKESVRVYTDNKDALAIAVDRRTGEKPTAIQEWNSKVENVKNSTSQSDLEAKNQLSEIKGNLKAETKSDFNLDDGKDIEDRNWEKIRALKLAEFEVEKQRLRVSNLAKYEHLRSERNHAKLRAHKVGIGVVNNLKNSIHNIKVIKRKAVNALKTTRVAVNSAKLKIQEYKLNNAPEFKEARVLREKMIKENWEKRAADSIKALENSIMGGSLKVKSDVRIEQTENPESSLREMFIKNQPKV